MIPYFSVIIPTYNRDYVINETIGMVLNQTFQDFELIVVDNGSTDSTRKVVAEIADPLNRIKYFYQSNTGGPAGSRNTGIKNSNGNFVAFLDSDDGWYPNKLEEMFNYLESLNPRKRLDVVAVANWENEVDQNSRIINVLRHGDKKIVDWQFKLNYMGNYFSPSAMVVRRETLIKLGGFNECAKLNTVEDYELWIRLSRLGEIHTVEKVLGYWANDGKGMTKNYRKNFDALENLYIRNFNERSFIRRISILRARYIRAKYYLKDFFVEKWGV